MALPCCSECAWLSFWWRWWRVSPPSRDSASPSEKRSGISGDGRRQPRQGPTTTTTTTTTTRAATTTTKSSSTGTLLEPPEPVKCASRPRNWSLDGHWYFYSADVPEYQEVDETTNETVGKRYNWLDARNLCRRHCMDSVSIETEREWKMVKRNISERGIIYLWTSGRLCDFKGCESREDLKPLNINGWFWSGTNVKMSATDKKPTGWSEQPWSPTGHLKKPQPDNAEFGINQTAEPCLGLLNGIYDDGIKWHDIACYHTKPVFCEDNPDLLNYARAVNTRDKLGLVIE
ncbi:uncharacterized protein LOC119097464 [Pollicipes pollicipes]|uniref:uncharacterized protein LOC119097464 n=1 Tax=Pollicipes pollicipes TaxID=41117 RepID=UPI00188581A3|nr:uncharacterized protein LOC119097464 [Pollicipes pollicipes]